MQQIGQKKTSQKVYDYAIIGSGLSGLLIANALNKISSNIILLDAGDSFGGHNRSIQTPIGLMNNGLRFLPANDLSMKTLPFLESLLNQPIEYSKTEVPSVTFESGTIKPFLGFGDTPPVFYDELSYFMSSHRLQMNLEPHEWTQILFNNYSGEFAPRSIVTKFHGENGQIKSATINGQKIIQALNFIYCADVKSLQRLLPEDALSSKSKQKLSKSKYWTAVCLDLLHNRAMTDLQAIHVLNGTTQDDIGPCVGQFHQPTTLNEQSIQFSQWISFIDDQDAEDSESIANCLKKIKRQIKRAYPEAFEQIKQERILVVPSISGDGDLKLNSNQTLPTYSNFWINSGAVHTQKNILGTLLQAELVCNSLGCHPLGIQPEINEESSAEEQTEGHPA